MSAQRDPLNVIICGVGGQGNILISRILGRGLLKAGYWVTLGETFGAAQRGGPVFSSLRISRSRLMGPLIPQGTAHCVLGLEPLETLRILKTYGHPDVVTVTNTSPIFPVGVLSGRAQYPTLQRLGEAISALSREAHFLNATEIAVQMGEPIVSNIVMLGAFLGTGSVPIQAEQIRQEILATMGVNKAEINLKAFERGYEATANPDH